MLELVTKYLSKMGLTGTEVFRKSEAEQLMNEHVIGIYKGRVSLREDKEFTAKEIAEKLSFIDDEWTRKFDEAWEKEFGE